MLNGWYKMPATVTFARKNFPVPKIPLWIFALIAVLYLSATRVDIMDVDASQYAEISREMAVSHDYLHLYDRGHDYLDKPPFLFWASSLSIRVFGVNNFGYRLPSILFALLALYATYRLARLLYDEATGRAAALVLGVCQGMFLMTNDVRCDTILTAWVITALWMIKECEIRRRWYYVLGGTAAIAFGMMTKGPIALFVPLFAFGTDWLLKRKWKQIFSPWHLLDAAIIAVLLIPMCIGLYQQYDMHPEKLIDGRHGTSGLRFFFWTQSFGRITGESSWDNGADISFLLLNMLWSFLPWILLLLAALGVNMRELVRQRFRLRDDQEWVSTGGFLLAYLALGSSHYQLPHYIFVAFPLCAIMVAGLLRRFLQDGTFNRLWHFFITTQWVMGALLMVGVLLIITIVFPAGWQGILLWAASTALWIYLAMQAKLRRQIVMLSSAAMIVVNIFLTHHFYYRLLQYQAGSQLGKYLHGHSIGEDQVMAYKMKKDPMSCVHYYAQYVVRGLNDSTHLMHRGLYVITMADGMDSLRQMGFACDTLVKGERFKVSELTPTFLNNKGRYKELLPYYLVRIK